MEQTTQQHTEEAIEEIANALELAMRRIVELEHRITSVENQLKRQEPAR